MAEANIEEFIASFDDSRFPGDFLHNYELMECLSHNEMGETLLVKDRQTGLFYVAKCYANKSLLSHTTESDLLKKLVHKGLPRFVGEYENEKMLCVVRSFVQGKSLDRLIQEQTLTKKQAINIAVQLCEILEYLHGQTPPIIHRDIKPQNIIVDEQGQITLIDFGSSRTYDETSQEDTLCLGTRHYAAPEQYGYSQTDCRTDVFSLGILLCWLLTGNVDAQQASKAMPNRWLARIVTKCTAFAPKDRYKNAAQVRDALTGRTIRRRALSILFAFLLILAAAFYIPKSTEMQNIRSSAITFKEPLIEEAVRLSLGKGETEKLSEQDLLSITELYVFGNGVAGDEETFNTYAKSFANNEGKILRGNIHVLDDLPKLKNLRRISLVYQNITDLTPLSGLTDLENIDLRHNPIEDVTPLSQVTSLSALSLFDTKVSDLTALQNCFHLSVVDVGYSRVESTEALNGLDSLKVLVIRKAPLQSLDQIKTHPMLEQIYLSETQVLDLSPLLDLPHLQLVEVDENMRAAVEAIADKARFKVVYQ